MSNFKERFLNYYLRSGLGSLTKRDIDALVMYLIDDEGIEENTPLKNLTNQQASIKLKIPASKVKSLRYEAALKFGGYDDNRAKVKFLEILTKAQFEAEKGQIVFIMEDLFISKWVQGLLKDKGIVFDTSFNTEIVRVNSESFCNLLSQLYDQVSVEKLRKSMQKVINQQSHISFSELKKEFIKGAVNGLGGLVTGPALSALITMAMK